MKKKREGKYGVRYDAAFKAEAVRLCRASDKSVDQVAEMIGVARLTLENWLRQAAIDEGGGGQGPLTTDERRELRRLRREVEDLQTANTILKKAAAFSDAKKR
jgi:transposase-like protein